MDLSKLNGLTYAYIGDGVYELFIREYVVGQGYSKVNTIHKKVIEYTNGGYQAFVIHKMLENNILTEEELNAFKRGRNSHVNTSRKNLELKDYLDATGFEALIGHLYLTDQKDRLNELLQYSISIKE